MKNSRVKANAGNVILLSVTMLLTVGVFDVFVRCYFHIPSNYLRKIVYFNDTLEPTKRLQPNLDLHVTGDFKEFTFRVRTDAEGNRWTPYVEPIDTPILVLGDSQTFGIGVNDEETYASVLSNVLKRKVINTGCPGYNTHEEYQRMHSYFQKSKSELVILGFFAGNDPLENFKNNPAITSGAITSSKVSFNKQWIKNYLIRNSSIYNLLTRLRVYPQVNQLLDRFGLINPQVPAELTVFSHDSDQKAAYWNITESAIMKIKTQADRQNVPLLVVFIPDRYQIDDAYWQQWVTKYRLNPYNYDRTEPNLVVQAICKKHNISFLDTTAALMEAQKKGFKVYWNIDNHLSPDGHQRIALLLRDIIESSILLHKPGSAL